MIKIATRALMFVIVAIGLYGCPDSNTPSTNSYIYINDTDGTYPQTGKHLAMFMVGNDKLVYLRRRCFTSNGLDGVHIGVSRIAHDDPFYTEFTEGLISDADVQNHWVVQDMVNDPTTPQGAAWQAMNDYCAGNTNVTIPTQIPADWTYEIFDDSVTYYGNPAAFNMVIEATSANGLVYYKRMCSPMEDMAAMSRILDEYHSQDPEGPYVFGPLSDPAVNNHPIRQHVLGPQPGYQTVQQMESYCNNL